RDVLEPAMVAPGINGNRPTLRRQIFSELDELVAKFQANHPYSESEYAFELQIVYADFNVRHFLEREHLRIEVSRTVHSGDGDSEIAAVFWCGRFRLRSRVMVCYRVIASSRSCWRLRSYSVSETPRRLSRCSPTRSALAMMVRAGLTAALDGKKLPSTT